MTKLKGTGDQPLWLDVASFLLEREGQYFTALQISEEMKVGFVSIQQACDMGRSYGALTRRLRKDNHANEYAFGTGSVAESLRKEAS